MNPTSVRALMAAVGASQVSLNSMIYVVTDTDEAQRIGPSGTLDRLFVEPVYSNRSTAVDKDHNVFIGHSGSIRKLSSFGSNQWVNTADASFSIDIMVADGSGNLIFVDGADVVKLNPSGVEQWRNTDNAGDVKQVVVDSSGNVYVAGGSDDVVRKLNSSGVQQWAFTGHTDTVLGVAVDSTGNVYSIAAGSDDRLIKINSAGSQQWARIFSNPEDICVDLSGNVYLRNFNGFHKIAPDNSVIWENADDRGTDGKMVMGYGQDTFWTATQFGSAFKVCRFSCADGSLLTEFVPTGSNTDRAAGISSVGQLEAVGITI